MRTRRPFLIAAAVWDIAAGVLLLVVPEGRGGVGTVTPTGRTRGFGGIVIAFGLLFAVLAARPVRSLLVVATAAKTVGAGSGVLALSKGQRDVVGLVSLADAVWLPGFLLALRRDRLRPRRSLS
jgi:hypothetical protein